MKESVRSAWISFNEPLEWRVRFMYLDVKGLVSTGIGNLIDATARPLSPPTAEERDRSLAMARQLAWQNPDGSPATADQVGAAWDAVKARIDRAPKGGGSFKNVTQLRISDAEIDRFVFAKLDEMEATLKGRPEFEQFDSFPADAQLGLLSMSWGMGPAFKFPKFQAFVKAGDWNAAATECRFQPEIGTIVNRNDHDQELFRNAARVVAEGKDPEVLLFAGPPALSRSPAPTTDPVQEPTPDPTTDPPQDTQDPGQDPTTDQAQEPTPDPTLDPAQEPTQDLSNNTERSQT